MAAGLTVALFFPLDDTKTGIEKNPETIFLFYFFLSCCVRSVFLSSSLGMCCPFEFVPRFSIVGREGGMNNNNSESNHF
jgi:hypothetical protein